MLVLGRGALVHCYAPVIQVEICSAILRAKTGSRAMSCRHSPPKPPQHGLNAALSLPEVSGGSCREDGGGCGLDRDRGCRGWWRGGWRGCRRIGRDVKALCSVWRDVERLEEMGGCEGTWQWCEKMQGYAGWCGGVYVEVQDSGERLGVMDGAMRGGMWGFWRDAGTVIGHVGGCRVHKGNIKGMWGCEWVMRGFWWDMGNIEGGCHRQLQPAPPDTDRIHCLVALPSAMCGCWAEAGMG